MRTHLARRIPVAAAMGLAVAMLALGLLAALGVRSLVTGTASAQPAVPNPGHSWSEIGDLPGTMWHSNNDGPGSGLDADTLDGLESTDFAAALPRGVIVAFHGTTVPDGWALCDGGTYEAPNGESVTTPNLVDKFIYGRWSPSTSGETGGAASHNHGGSTGAHTLTLNEIPPHAHSIASFHHAPGNRPGVVAPDWDIYPVGTWTGSTGGGQPHSHGISSTNHLPPYYRLAYIMKL